MNGSKESEPMVYTDGIHLVADSVEELHEFALSIGLKREWFQDKCYQHYDILSNRILQRAIKLGALRVEARYIVKRQIGRKIKQNDREA